MNRSHRFEIVRTGAGWHARFKASNGRIIMASEVYKSRAAALSAIRAVAAAFSVDARVWITGAWVTIALDDSPLGAKRSVPICTVDERNGR